MKVIYRQFSTMFNYNGIMIATQQEKAKDVSTKILIIEDDPLILKHTLEILNLEGFETIGAEDGLVGLTYATLYLPNLIISDITMPGLDGYQLLTEVRKNPLTAAIPFIF